MKQVTKPIANNTVPAPLENLDRLSRLLDSQFSIPGTKIRFGLDAIIGLFPFGGDVLSFIFSAGLVTTMATHGVSGQVLGKMLFNIFLDTTLGSVPIVGDLFDMVYKSNRRNYKLLEEHYGEGAYQGSIWRIVIPVLLVLVLMFALMIYVIARLSSFIWGLV
jgi:Domain of unknown function (DUF4112)